MNKLVIIIQKTYCEINRITTLGKICPHPPAHPLLYGLRPYAALKGGLCYMFSFSPKISIYVLCADGIIVGKAPLKEAYGLPLESGHGSVINFHINSGKITYPCHKGFNKYVLMKGAPDVGCILSITFTFVCCSIFEVFSGGICFPVYFYDGSDRNNVIFCLSHKCVTSLCKEIHCMEVIKISGLWYPI